MDDLRLSDDEAVLDKLPHVLTRVGISDLCGLVRVQPDLPLATFQHGGS